MRFRVTGSDEKTRASIELVVEAESEAAAWRDAKRRGMIIKSVERADDPSLALRALKEPIPVRIDPGHIQLIEQTAKRWKGLLAISLLVMTIGVALGGWMLLRSPRSLAHPPAGAWIGGALALLGLAGVIAARLGAWWKHG